LKSKDLDAVPAPTGDGHRGGGTTGFGAAAGFRSDPRPAGDLPRRWPPWLAGVSGPRTAAPRCGGPGSAPWGQIGAPKPRPRQVCGTGGGQDDDREPGGRKRWRLGRKTRERSAGRERRWWRRPAPGACRAGAPGVAAPGAMAVGVGDGPGTRGPVRRNRGSGAVDRPYRSGAAPRTPAARTQPSYGSGEYPGRNYRECRLRRAGNGDGGAVTAGAYGAMAGPRCWFAVLVTAWCRGYGSGGYSRAGDSGVAYGSGEYPQAGQGGGRRVSRGRLPGDDDVLPPRRGTGSGGYPAEPGLPPAGSGRRGAGYPDAAPRGAAYPGGPDYPESAGYSPGPPGRRVRGPRPGPMLAVRLGLAEVLMGPARPVPLRAWSAGGVGRRCAAAAPGGQTPPTGAPGICPPHTRPPSTRLLSTLLPSSPLPGTRAATIPALSTRAMTSRAAVNTPARSTPAPTIPIPRTIPAAARTWPEAVKPQMSQGRVTGEEPARKPGSVRGCGSRRAGRPVAPLACGTQSRSAPSRYHDPALVPDPGLRPGRSAGAAASR
jgi:hypothetical protein